MIFGFQGEGAATMASTGTPAFYFYNNGRYVSGRKLICKAEVLDKESYFLVSAQLKKHGLKYREPKNTMEAYERARVRKNYNRHWLE